MKKNLFQQLLVKWVMGCIAGLVLLANPIYAAEHSQLKAFPEAKQGMERLVIILPHKDRGEDERFKVELIPGKTMKTDGINTLRLNNGITSHPLKGWGYTYYEVIGKELVMSTLIGVPEGTLVVEKFVPGNSLMIRYNSRLPIVIYAPKGYEIRYRIWNAGKMTKADKA